jgi:catechol 2,3-dioxygenase-like lactoylglutathione lyase family enzyme
MLHLTQIVRVDIPVRDRDEAIAFYTETLGFSLVVDTPFGDGQRWVEVAPPGGGVTVALTEPADVFPPGRMTGVVLRSADPRADHATLEAAQVDVGELIGGDGTIPLLFFLRDPSDNQLMVIEEQQQGTTEGWGSSPYERSAPDAYRRVKVRWVTPLGAETASMS